MYDVIVIGGGASGVFAAIHAARQGVKVAIIERNEKLMRKLAITGKGRCNLTNNCDIETMMKNIPKNARFLYSALSACDSRYVMDFFEKIGVPLKTERGGRVFPVSDKAQDIVNALLKETRRLKIEVIRDRITRATKSVLFTLHGEKQTYNATKIIIATGGMSYPKTGSTGDGYSLASEFGHTIIPLKPSLVPIEVAEKVLLGGMSGLSLKNVGVCLHERHSNKSLYKGLGEMLFTPTALSGPLILTLSSYIKQSEQERYTISIDFKPALDQAVLDKRLLRDFAESKNKQFINSLNKILPAKVIPPFVKKVGIEPEKRVNEITRHERQKIITLMKNFKFTFTGFQAENAVITDGGVDTKEINPKTMESKIVENLRFCGEVIDVAALTGGFNLQIAFSTGYLAAIG
ncbi:MAG: NAD(P)/FAD-dependent oxidoreductase [Oscillospiraceae bacterium]|nr:NAD(P)/FAD-dependent oxidoreductase [Oscillospiraceae bacterium]